MHQLNSGRIKSIERYEKKEASRSRGGKRRAEEIDREKGFCQVNSLFFFLLKAGKGSLNEAYVYRLEMNILLRLKVKAATGGDQFD
jgi:hypothetical protein